MPISAMYRNGGKTIYSGDLNSKFIWYLNGQKQFIPWMVCYSSHVLNSKLIVHYLNSTKSGNWMAFGCQCNTYRIAHTQAFK